MTELYRLRFELKNIKIENNLSCPICLEENLKSVCITRCNHKICTDCMIHLINDKIYKCPLCRCNLNMQESEQLKLDHYQNYDFRLTQPWNYPVVSTYEKEWYHLLYQVPLYYSAKLLWYIIKKSVLGFVYSIVGIGVLILFIIPENIFECFVDPGPPSNEEIRHNNEFKEILKRDFNKYILNKYEDEYDKNRNRMKATKWMRFFFPKKSDHYNGTWYPVIGSFNGRVLHTNSVFNN